MFKKAVRILGVLVLILLSLIGWYAFFSERPEITLPARLKYNEAIRNRVDLSSGPCLGKISNDWVLDIAHLPREVVDDLPENQCLDYLSGKVHHFIEMTPKGEVVTIK